jgi:Tfp pilus assembly protein PilO
VTRSTKTLIPALLGVVAIAAFYFLVLSPKREESAKLDAQITKEQSAAEQAESLAKQYEAAKVNYKANYAMVARLGKAVPADDDVRSLLVQIDAAAKKAKVDFRALNVSSTSTATAEPPAGDGSSPAPGSVPVGSAGFSAMPFKFAFSGSYFQLSDFFTRLEDFVTVQNDKIDVTGRLMLLGAITVTPDTDNVGELKAEIGAATYIVPPTEGVTAGATPDAPSGAATASAPADSGAAAPTTPATITGVR